MRLDFSTFLLGIDKAKFPYTHYLYPYTTERFTATFMYGKDVPPPRLPGFLVVLSVGNYWFIIVWFSLTTIILFVIRWQAGVKSLNNNISSSTLDMITVFCGGGTIRFRHRLDRIYLVIMLIGSFFLLSYCVSTFKSRITSPDQLNNVNSLEKLARLNVPIYASNSLGNDTQYIFSVMRLVVSTFFYVVCSFL